MSKYLLRRLLILIPVLAGISVILFTILALAPGDPFEELATNPAVPPEVRATLRAQFGLDDPVYVRYLHWLAAMLRGDWGFSFVSRIDADTLLYRFTVEDPRTWAKPWSGEYPWPATAERVFEYACHEGNYALGNIMRGARMLEAEAVANKAERALGSR